MRLRIIRAGIFSPEGDGNFATFARHEREIIVAVADWKDLLAVGCTKVKTDKQRRSIGVVSKRDFPTECVALADIILTQVKTNVAEQFQATEIFRRTGADVEIFSC